VKLGKTTPSLRDEITALRDKLTAWLDNEAAEEKKTCPGVPANVLRQLMSNEAPGCLCLQTLKRLEAPK
jgi:hypothetical protein